MSVKADPSIGTRRLQSANWYRFAIASLLVILPHPADAFRIMEPVEGAALTAGSIVTARVDLGKDTGIVKVYSYWYGGKTKPSSNQTIQPPVARSSSRSRWWEQLDRIRPLAVR